MPALAEQTITAYRGQAIVLRFSTLTPENITGYTLKFTVTGGLNQTAKKIGPLTMNHVDEVNGVFDISLTEDQLDMNPATYRWDVWRIDEGLETPYAIGPFVLLGNSRVPPVDTP